jgi:hypothetical protein
LPTKKAKLNAVFTIEDAFKFMKTQLDFGKSQ